MAFLFKPRSKPPPVEIARALKESFLALDTSTAAMALEEVEKNIASMKLILLGDGEVEPNEEHISQFVDEICKGEVIPLFIQKLPSLNWEARKKLGQCWAILLRHNIDSKHCCVEYLASHVELLDFLVACYKNKEIALNCGIMLRECIKYPTLTKCILESTSFELFFIYVELPTFDIASDALSTFKDLLTKHEDIVAEYLCSHYQQFFEGYEKLLASSNYVTRRQSLKFLSDFLLEPQNSQTMKRYILEVKHLKTMMRLLKDSSKNIQISAFHVFKVFVANPHKSQEIVNMLVENHDELLMSLHSLPVGKGEDDQQLQEERDLVIEEIARVAKLPKPTA